jgi:hypothetical protein
MVSERHPREPCVRRRDRRVEGNEPDRRAREPLWRVLRGFSDHQIPRRERDGKHRRTLLSRPAVE